MRTKEEHKEYMRQWRIKKKLALNPQNSPELPKIAIKLPSGDVTASKTYQSPNQNCDISPTRKFINIYMFHPVRKKRIYLIECSGKTLLFFKNLGYEIEKNEK